jgi:ubiquinone/menaquinone biosynthesis C-methylase UbiE
MKKVMCGNELDRMPNWAFRIMAFMFSVGDFFRSPGKRLDPFNIQKGQTVIDYGCGTGRYLRQASELVGENGIVYAVDIHELAIKAAANIIKKYDLNNVHPLLTDGKSVSLPPDTADVVYALDMFHMVKDTGGFLKELCRIIKPNGCLFLEDGHQSRALAKEKVLNSGCWNIMTETKQTMKCQPMNKTR